MSGAAPLATARQIRIQCAIDSGAALVLAMLAWPFPLARVLLPVAVNVASVLVFWQLVQIAYFAIALSLWGQTAGMRLMGLHLACRDEAELSRGDRARWGARAGALAIPRLISPPKSGEGAASSSGIDVVGEVDVSTD